VAEVSRGEVKFPGPKDDSGCLLGTLRALTTLRRLTFLVAYAAVMAPITDAALNIAIYPR